LVYDTGLDLASHGLVHRGRHHGIEGLFTQRLSAFARKDLVDDGL
jgi:hypothetical protein